MIAFITDPQEKKHIAAEVLASLPDWFGIPESTAEYIRESRSMPFWAAVEAGEAAGFIALKATGPRTAEIYVMGVKPEYHRRGMGRALWEAFREFARTQGFRYAQVKTVRRGCYEIYDRTNDFYESIGFEELECFPALWDECNPCQVYVQYIG